MPKITNNFGAKLLSKFKIFLILILFGLGPIQLGASPVKVGADCLFEKEFIGLVKGKKIGLISNLAAVNSQLKTTFEIIKSHSKECTLVSAFAPEHGFNGSYYAYEEIGDHEIEGIPLYGLHGSRKRPTPEMLEKLDVLIFDLQDIGTRSYTFSSTLCYCMEEAAKAGKPLIVLDRPNPMGGIVVDGPGLQEKWRSFLGYVNVPYCHGMTMGELAQYFNGEYQIGCKLTVVPCQGWKRGVAFSQTGLPWVPTSPQMPESDTPLFYPTTGLIGHCSLLSIGVGYTLPFKLAGAPWIEAERFAAALNEQKLPGVAFQPFYYRPFFGKFKSEDCQGVRIFVTDPNAFLPVTTQFTLMGVLKNLYPKQFEEAIANLAKNNSKCELFHKLNGSEEIFSILANEKYIIWKLRALCDLAREQFLPIRSKYLIASYEND